MAFNVVLKNIPEGRYGCSDSHSFWIDEPKHLWINPSEIESIEIDGEELEFVRSNFSGIPMNDKKSSITWRGNLAQFIFENL